MPGARPSLEAIASTKRLLIDRLTTEVVGALERANVPAIVLKGPVLADWLYSDRGEERLYSDTDLLVAPGHASTADEVLRDLGFANVLAAFDHPRIDARVWRRGEHEVVDLHTALWGPAAEPQVVWSILWGMTERHLIAGERLLVLEPVPRAMHLALHAAQHGPARKVIEDLRRAVETLPERQWGAAARLAERLGAGDAFAAGLRLLPEGQSLAVRLGLTGYLSLEASLRVEPIPLAQGFEHLSRLPGARAKLALVARELVPPRAFMRWWLPLARRGPRGLTVAYLWRVLWLIGHAPAGLRAWLRARRAVRRGRDRGTRARTVA